MPKAEPDQTRFRVADLPDRRETRFEVVPTADQRAKIAERLKILDIRKLRFAGSLRPEGSRGWVLEADLGATVVQSCVVTLDPVTTRVEETALRRYTPDIEAAEAEARAQADADGVPMPEDDSLEPLPQVIDVAEVMEEALALALPLYPRADGAAMGGATFAEPGTKPLEDEDVKPFAGLASLRDKLAGDSEDPEDK
ncbi:YceD family protein [Pseudooceanicola atlanticus]|uniref:50S ribosomal protein L34 n=1 Tax=Pseudooceanicola atlanticus TaxID=1461694 RepID=A0A0A0EF48_9RHOB|nr:DUF177 domain-containing protein [Pseudooceanicola atlanticus]KGM48718.1 hypothetical protein ATO9_08325 [Pseudooceanicola atlanticus]